MVDIHLLKESLNPKFIVAYYRFKFEFYRVHSDYFEPDGLVVFCGSQGSGKTLSAVNYVCRLMEEYPKAKLVTNIEIEGYPIVTFEEYKNSLDFDDESAYGLYKMCNRVFEFCDNDDFQRYDNDEFGVIFLVDEIQLYLNSLESKNVNLEVITQISQQRKQRKHIVSTSQVFGRMAKPLREQFSSIIACKDYFGFLQCNRLIDRDSMETEESTGTNITGKVVKKFWWIRTPSMFRRYDTYRVIERGRFTSGEKRIDIYDSKKKVG